MREVEGVAAGAGDGGQRLARQPDQGRQRQRARDRGVRRLRPVGVREHGIHAGAARVVDAGRRQGGEQARELVPHHAVLSGEDVRDTRSERRGTQPGL